MDPKLKKRWCAALRSGAYQQGQEYLFRRDTGAYCCLGVLWDITGGRWEHHPYNCYAVRMPDGSLNYGGLPESVLDPGIQDALIIMNDGIVGSNVHTFTEIADWIKENL